MKKPLIEVTPEQQTWLKVEAARRRIPMKLLTRELIDYAKGHLEQGRMKIAKGTAPSAP